MLLPGQNFRNSIVRDYRRSVYVFPIPQELDEETVAIEFEICGEVEQVTFASNARLRQLWIKYAFVQFITVEAADKALTLDEFEPWGEPLEIRPARSNG